FGARHDVMRLHGQFPSSVLVRGVRFLRSAPASHATRPPVEVEPTTASVMVEMHAGHMACSPFTSLSNGRAPDRHRPPRRGRRYPSGVASGIARATSTRVPARRASRRWRTPDCGACRSIRPGAIRLDSRAARPYRGAMDEDLALHVNGQTCTVRCDPSTPLL